MPCSDFQRANGLEQAFFNGSADAHHFSGRHHLGSERVVSIGELVERKPGHLGHYIIQGRLKRGDCIGRLNFI